MRKMILTGRRLESGKLRIWIFDCDVTETDLNDLRAFQVGCFISKDFSSQSNLQNFVDQKFQKNIEL